MHAFVANVVIPLSLCL